MLNFTVQITSVSSGQVLNLNTANSAAQDLNSLRHTEGDCAALYSLRHTEGDCAALYSLRHTEGDCAELYLLNSIRVRVLPIVDNSVSRQEPLWLITF